MVEQRGYAHDRQTHVAGDNHDHSQTHIVTYVGEREGSEKEKGTGDINAGAAAGGGLGFVIVLLVVGYLIFGNDEPFPQTSDPLPAGATNEEVIKAADDWLRNCQTSESPSPANCPQSLNDSSSDVSKVRWNFFGNPLEGAVVKFNQDENRFDVLGTMVGKHSRPFHEVAVGGWV
jgi:hypothetical protein